MSLEMPKAVVFNCHYNGLSIIQELGRNGIKCIAMDPERSIGTYSKYGKYIKCPNPAFDEKGLIDFLYDYCAKQELKPVLFPTNDHWAVALSKYYDVLKEVALPCVSELKTVNLLVEKDEFYKIGQRRGYLTPVTWPLEELSRIDDKNFPICAKPQFRRNISISDATSFFNEMDRLRLTVINNKHELEEFMDKEKRLLKHLVFQEYIRGFSDRMYTVGIYANELNEIIGQFTGRKLRGYPADIGDCVVGENYSLPEYIIKNTERIAKEIEFSGIAEFEYMKDLKTGEFKLIEINPRSWSWVGITPYCDVSLPMIAYRDLIGEKQQFASNQHITDGSVRYAKIIQDFQNCFFRYKKNHPEWHMNFRQWLKDYRQAEKVVYAEFHAYDLIVACIAILGLLKFALLSIMKNVRKIGNKV